MVMFYRGLKLRKGRPEPNSAAPSRRMVLTRDSASLIVVK